MAESTMHADSQHLMHDDSPQQLRYYYLDKRVKGESVRLALVVGGIEFEDVRLTYEEVQNMRAAGKLPLTCRKIEVKA